MDNKSSFLALNRIPTIGPRTVRKLWDKYPDLSEVFQLSPNELVSAGISHKQAYAIAQFDCRAVETDYNWQQGGQNRYLLTWEDAAYPKLLHEIYNAPPVIYVIGNLASLSQRTVAIVGSRSPTIHGAEIAFRFGSELAKQNITIVSGLALGVDAQAHTGCLQANGMTVGVLATGIDCIYPARHKKLAASMMENGLLISEFPLGSPPIPGHFPRRNRIISGLSLATLVVEAAICSGSLITARFALEQNREVMAIPGAIQNAKTKGCHYLIQQGAKLITSSEEVITELRQDYIQHARTGLNAGLANDSENLVKCVGFEATSIDKIIECSGLSMAAVTCELAELELMGIVKAIAGGYMRCDV